MATAELNGAAIKDFDRFHAECKAAFGFPDTYANPMDAWIDCLSYVRDEDGMTKFHLKPNELLEIVIKDAAAMKAAVPDILEELAGKGDREK